IPLLRRPSAPTLFPYTTLFRSHSHLFGELMDLEPDRRAGRRTLAGVLGARPAKWLLVGFLAAEAVLIWTSARDPWLAAFLAASRSEEHTSELQSRGHLVCRLLL